MIRSDVLIVGGGIAGLLAFRRLKNAGLSVVLLEKNALGEGQTLASQGIIHGGSKYALQGKLNASATEVAEMTGVWAKYLRGEGIDLSRVKCLSSHHYLWASGFAASLKTLISSKVLSSENRVLAPKEYPDFFKVPEFSGSLCELDEVVLDPLSLLQELVGSDLECCIQVSNQVKAHWNLSQQVEKITDGSIEFQANYYLFMAGVGNESYLPRGIYPSPMKGLGLQRGIFSLGEVSEPTNSKGLLGGEEAFSNEKRQGWKPVSSLERGIETQVMQTRPLNMVAVKHPDLKPIYLHYVGKGVLPELTITSHPSSKGSFAWYLGGAIAEEGVHRSDEEQKAVAQAYLARLFSWKYPKVVFDEAHYECFSLVRAERFNHGKRPDGVGIWSSQNAFMGWPTKLTLAPALVEEIFHRMDFSGKIGVDCALLKAQLDPLPKAQWGKAWWESDE